MNATIERLAEIKARCAKASTAPWIWETGPYSGSNWLIGSSVDGLDYHITTDHVHASELNGDAKTDAEFIANARQDIPWLIAMIERLLFAFENRP